MNINHSNLSAREHLNLNGRVPRDMLEALLDREDRLTALDGLEAHISEALGCFPAEDFLNPIKELLVSLHKNLRGANKDKLAGIIEDLDDLAQCTFYESDYGRDELRKAKTAIEAATTSEP